MKQLDEDVVNLKQPISDTPPEENPTIPDLGQIQSIDNDLDVLLYNHVL